jgi:cytidine deaminase
MKELNRSLSIQVLTWAELSSIEQELVMTAIEVRNKAQAPYSHYHVGAALVSARGRVYRGCNVERCTYTQTTHAEQAAVDAMVAAEGAGAKLRAMAIAGAPAGTEFPYPTEPFPEATLRWEDVCPSCGHCLQIILENCGGNPDVTLLEPHTNGLIARTTVGHALPMRFDPSGLGISYE